jgi:hypothetical protein
MRSAIVFLSIQLLFTVATAAAAPKKTQIPSCAEIMSNQHEEFRHPELAIDLQSNPKIVYVLGTKGSVPDSRNILADIEFEVALNHLSIKFVNAGSGTRGRRNFADLLMSRLFAQYPNANEVSQMLFSDDLDGFLEGLNQGLSTNEALALTKPAQLYRKFGFTQIKSFHVHLDETLFVNVIFAKL